MKRYRLRVPKSWAIPFWVGETYQQNRSEALELLENALWKLIGSEALFAVRSSAEGEDESKRSFAGQFTSVLNVPGNKLVESVEKVWESLATQRLEGYSGSPGRMGVLLQVMVPSEISGVAFSCDPLSGRKVAVVEAVKGDGSRLVQDGITPWRYEMTSDLVELTADGDLDRAVLKEVVRTTFRLREQMGEDLDLEWVFDGRKLNWVQMRRMTGLKGLDRYTNTFSQEFLPGMIKPLVWSVNVPINSYAWVRLLGELTGRKDLMAENLAKSFYYRAYFNMGEFSKVWQAMGMPDDLLERMVLMKGDSKMRFRPNPKLMLTFPRIVRFLWSKKRWFPEIDGTLLELRQAYERRTNERLDRLSDEELMNRADGLLQEGIRSAYYTVLCIMASSMVTRMWKRYLERRGLDWQNMSLATGGDGGYPEERLRELHDLICEVEPDMSFEQLGQTPRHDRAYVAFKAFLDEYGHYSESGNDCSVPPWREDPDMVLDIVRNVPQRERSKGVLARGPLVSGLQRQEAKFRSYRERMGSMYTRHYGLFRRYFLEMGERLQTSGRLECREDIFMIDLEELRRSLHDDMMDLRTLASDRYAEMERLKDVSLPPIIYGDDTPPVHRGSLKVLKGSPSSGGYYRGKATVVRGLADMKKLEKGDVLVIPYSDVGWTPFFHLAGAVVSESGGILSHSSIIAREYGIPAVVSVPDAMRLKDGTILEIDGYRGEVVIDPSSL